MQIFIDTFPGLTTKKIFSFSYSFEISCWNGVCSGV